MHVQMLKRMPVSSIASSKRSTGRSCAWNGKEKEREGENGIERDRGDRQEKWNCAFWSSGCREKTRRSIAGRARRMLKGLQGSTSVMHREGQWLQRSCGRAQEMPVTGKCSGRGLLCAPVCRRLRVGARAALFLRAEGRANAGAILESECAQSGNCSASGHRGGLRCADPSTLLPAQKETKRVGEKCCSSDLFGEMLLLKTEMQSLQERAKLILQ